MTAPDPFEGRLIRLRAREPGDAPLYHAWMNDPAVTEHLTLRYPLSVASEDEWVRSTGAVGYGSAGFAVVRKDTGALIGSVDLRSPSPENRTAELGIAIGDKTCWDGGYGTDAMRTICRFGFEMMNLHRIWLTVYASNERGQHVYRKLGFVHEARLRDAVYKFGRYQDLLVMGLLEGELRPE